MMTLNIVIPVLNEEKRLRKGVTRTVEYLDNTVLAGKYTITIADNGSTDQTEKISQSLMRQYKNVSYFKVSEKGVGLAFREAIRQNSCDIIGYMDVDLATDINHLCQMYDCFEKKSARIVVGSRLLGDSRVYDRTLVREITSRALNLILKVILKVHFSDAMCGFKFYRKEAAEELVRVCSQNKGWFYCAEMMIYAEWKGIKISELPIQWHDDKNSKVKIVKLSRDYMREIMRLYKIKKEHRF